MGILTSRKEPGVLDSSYLAEVYLHSQAASIFDVTLRFIIFSNENDKHQEHWVGILTHILTAMRETISYYNRNFEYKRMSASKLVDLLWYYWKPIRLLSEVNLLLEFFPTTFYTESDTTPNLSNFVISFLNRNLPLLKRAIIDLIGDVLDSSLPVNDVSFLYLEILQCLILVDEVNADEKSFRQVDFSDFEQAIQTSLVAKSIACSQKILATTEQPTVK